MAAGCVPVVIGMGGQLEIVQDKESGLLWHTIDQLKQNTIELSCNEKLIKALSRQAIKRSKDFSWAKAEGNFTRVRKEKMVTK